MPDYELWRNLTTQSTAMLSFAQRRIGVNYFPGAKTFSSLSLSLA